MDGQCPVFADTSLAWASAHPEPVNLNGLCVDATQQPLILARTTIRLRTSSSLSRRTIALTRPTLNAISRWACAVSSGIIVRFQNGLRPGHRDKASVEAIDDVCGMIGQGAR